MTDVVLSDIEDNSGTIAAINANFAKLEVAINDTFSSAGDATNVMNSTLDANSHRIINLPAPQNGADAARLVDITNIGTGTTLPSVSGQSGRYLSNDGTSAAWRTIPSARVNIMDYDPTNSIHQGVIDATPAYDLARAAIGNQGTVEFPKGYFRGAFTIPTPYLNIVGAGLQATVLRPLSATGTVITVNMPALGVEPCSVRDVRIEGVGLRQGIGIDHASTNAGHIILERCYIKNLEKCVSRPYGNFGFWSLDCQYGDADYHFYNVAAASAHSGVFTVERGRCTSARLAVFYLDCPTVQAGQIEFSNIVIEGNPGYLFYVKSANGIGVPSIQVRRCWNENNATATGITVGGVTADARWASINNCANAFILDDTPFSLINIDATSKVESHNCDITYSSGASIAPGGRMTHTNARIANYQNPPGLIKNITAISGQALGTGSWLTMPQLISLAPALGKTTHVRNDSSTPYNFTGTATIATTSQSDSAIGGLTTCQDLVMTGAQTEAGPNSGPTPILAGRYLCWTWTGKLLSGTAPTLRVLGGIPVSLFTTIDNTEFETKKGMIKLATDNSFVQFGFVSVASCTVRMAGWEILSFADEKLALDWINTNAFPTS